MRNFIAIAAALGFLLPPSARTQRAATTTTELAAAKMKVDCKDEKNKDNRIPASRRPRRP